MDDEEVLVPVGDGENESVLGVNGTEGDGKVFCIFPFLLYF